MRRGRERWRARRLGGPHQEDCSAVNKKQALVWEDRKVRGSHAGKL